MNQKWSGWKYGDTIGNKGAMIDQRKIRKNQL